MRRKGATTVLYLAFLLLSGCTRGIIYTDVVRPLTRNMNVTPTSETHARSSTKRLAEPVSVLNASAEWSSRAIGDAAQKENFKKIYFADMRTESYLLGIWQKKTVHVYGATDEEPQR